MKDFGEKALTNIVSCGIKSVTTKNIKYNNKQEWKVI